MRMKRPPTVLRFHKLRRLLTEYVRAIKDLSWAGALPPEEVPAVEEAHKRAKEKLYDELHSVESDMSEAYIELGGE